VPADIGVLSDKAVVLGETTNGIHCNIMGAIWYPHASEDCLPHGLHDIPYIYNIQKGMDMKQ
jgi:hypothetical protein